MKKKKKLVIKTGRDKETKVKRQRKAAGPFHRPTRKIKPQKGKGSYSRKKEKKELENEIKSGIKTTR